MRPSRSPACCWPRAPPATTGRRPPRPRPAPPRTDAPSAAPAPSGAAVIACGHAIGHVPPTSPDSVVLDAVALPREVLQPVRLPDGTWWAKTGLYARAGMVVDVLLAPQAAAGTTIGWGSPGVPGTAQRVPGCPGDGWLNFAGGYTVPAPACVPLLVRAGGREARAAVAVGAACPR